MNSVDLLQQQYQRSGYYAQGLITGLNDTVADVTSFGRPHERQGVPTNAVDSKTPGTDNLFLIGQEHDRPAGCGLWPWIT